MSHRKPTNAAVYGIDLGKNVFHIAGAGADGAIIGNWKLQRDTVLQFFRAAAPALIGMEACPGSQWLARHLQRFGHRVRIIPAQFVKPYVKSNKNDSIDAAAIAQAVARPTMRVVEIKSAAQAELQALHRIRDRMVANRTHWSARCGRCASSLASRFTDSPGHRQVQSRHAAFAEQRGERSDADDPQAPGGSARGLASPGETH